MAKNEYGDALKCLENCNISEEKKIRFIENLNKLININFNNFIKDGHILN